MKKLTVLFGLLAVFTLGTLAQEAPDKPEAKKPATPEFELSAGYTYRSYGVQTGVTLGMNGWYASVGYNFKRWLGAEAEILGVYKNQGLAGKTDVYTFLVGPRLYPLGHHKVTPFGHLLFGAGHYNKAIPTFGGFPAQFYSDTAYAWEGGGGLDVYVRKHLGIRLIQVDVGHTGFSAGNPTTSQSSRRVSVGIVYRFSEQ